MASNCSSMCSRTEIADLFDISITAVCLGTWTMLLFFYAETHFICLPRGAGSSRARTEESKEETRRL